MHGERRRDVPSCVIAFDARRICCASFMSHFSCISGVGEGKRTGTTFESANEHSTKSECRKRTCWYATRRGQRTANRLVCVPRAGSANSAEEIEDVAAGAGEGLRRKSISYTPTRERRM